ncbi:MAG: hypothetical protein AAFV51_10115, partial [Pseudomonadota bacterium]
MAQTYDFAAVGAEPRRSAIAAKSVCVLGSTGSIGVNTLDLLKFASERGEAEVRVVALTANSNIALLAEQCRAFRPEFAAVADPARYEDLKDALAGLDIEIGAGPGAIVEAAERDADWEKRAAGPLDGGLHHVAGADERLF